MHSARVPDGLHNIARPGLTLCTDHRSTFRDTTQGLSEIPAPEHERDSERVLVDVVDFVRGREHLTLVDVVHIECLQDLSFDEVTDTSLGHDRDGHRGLDLLDHGRVGHASDATVLTDVSGHTLK